MVEREVNKLLQSDAATQLGSLSRNASVDEVVGGRVADVELDMKPLVQQIKATDEGAPPTTTWSARGANPRYGIRRVTSETTRNVLAMGSAGHRQLSTPLRPPVIQPSCGAPFSLPRTPPPLHPLHPAAGTAAGDKAALLKGYLPSDGGVLATMVPPQPLPPARALQIKTRLRKLVLSPWFGHASTLLVLINMAIM